MNLLKKILFHLTRKQKPEKRLDKSFFVFQQTGDVLRAENVLKEAQMSVEVMGPPPWLRTGCDMVLVSSAVAEPEIRQCLHKAGIEPEQVLPLAEDMLEPVSLYQTRDLGDYLLVRAANMKITIAKDSGVIVNISGGGCPDVPYLASCLIGKTIADCEEPGIKGQTLCSYALQKAFLEARRLWQNGL